MEGHILHIHEDLPAEIGLETRHDSSNNNNNKTEQATFQEMRSFSRPVLRRGFSVHRGQRGRETVLRKSFPMSSKSFGEFGSNARAVNGEMEMKGDFSLFRTRSALAKQSSFVLRLMKENDVDHPNHQNGNGSSKEANDSPDDTGVPAGRFFAALTGPELDQVKEHEYILFPKEEKWPFLLRFPINCFGIGLGLSSQAVLWRTINTSSVTESLHTTPHFNLVLWIVALLILFLISSTYILKCIFYFEAVKREYFHPVRVNFFFAPWVACMFLIIGAPELIAPTDPHPALFCAFVAPIFILELKIYGQWLSGGKRRLSKVANASSHLSVIGNFVGAILAAKVGWKEPAKFFWAVGFAHYLVVFVTLYQRLPTNEILPKELHPVYSMFIAAPSAASIAWASIYDDFDGLSRTCYFIALFLYILLVIRINFFRGFRFSVAWWSYTFPMTTASIATIKYAEQVPSTASKYLALILSFISSTVVFVLFISTLLHAFVWRTLFPNDLAIAITKRNQGTLRLGKKAIKRGHNIKRREKQAPLTIVSSST